MITLGITVGEPAGIGPDVVLAALERNWSARLIVFGDAEVLHQRAVLLDKSVEFQVFADLRSALSATDAHQAGRVPVVHRPVAAKVQPGVLSTDNAEHVLTLLQNAHEGCRSGALDGMVTGPVHKGVINEAGITFSGHTEWLSQMNGAVPVLMLMHSAPMKVAMATTHIPLAQVPQTLSKEGLVEKIALLRRDWKRWFAQSEPRIVLLGLNPHAGEQGHIGEEEITLLAPVVECLRSQGAAVEGPVSADTAFVCYQHKVDVFFGMYHDQVLPVFKFASFGQGANVTLGLPYIRVSVDHGTALPLAGTNRASTDSMCYAIDLAIRMAMTARQRGQ